MKSPDSDSMLLSKMSPTTSRSLLSTGEPELPPMMSFVEAKSSGVASESPAGGRRIIRRREVAGQEPGDSRGVGEGRVGEELGRGDLRGTAGEEADDQRVARPEPAHEIAELRGNEQALERRRLVAYRQGPLRQLLELPRRRASRFRSAVAREERRAGQGGRAQIRIDRKSTRLNSSHVATSYAVFCLK